MYYPFVDLDNTEMIIATPFHYFVVFLINTYMHVHKLHRNM